VLTQCGRDFRPVVIALLTWGNSHFAPEGKSVVLINRETGVEAEPVLIDAVSGRPISDRIFKAAPGPAAQPKALPSP
jgi:hypothetical protein